MKTVYSSLGTIKRDYMRQLIYYYNKEIGNISEIAGATITKVLIKTV